MSIDFEIPTEAKANAWVCWHPEGETRTKAPGAHEPSIPNPLSGIAAVGDFFSKLGQANTWIRVGEALLGIILIGIGLARITGAQNLISKAVKAAPLAAI